MSNEINAFELTDEQLETVSGGSAGNSNYQGNLADGTTLNGVAFAKNVKQSGSEVSQTNKSSQQAFNSFDFTALSF
jgi:hypothetical protein